MIISKPSAASLNIAYQRTSFSETGTIALDDGKIDYIPQKKETVSDAVDLEHEFALWCNTMRMNPSKITMDEYLQENSRIYSRAE